jgi:predicted Zn finger-like uncharacterized protein
MKFTCDKCNAKYSISDDKLTKKVLKIRCKKCSHTIILRDPESKTGQHAHKTSRSSGSLHSIDAWQDSAQAVHYPNQHQHSQAHESKASASYSSLTSPYTQRDNQHHNHTLSHTHHGSYTHTTPSQDREPVQSHISQNLARDLYIGSDLDDEDGDEHKERTVIARISKDWLHQIRKEKQEEPVWFMALNNTPHGPVVRSEIEKNISEGNIRRNTLIWKGGWPNWLAAGSVDELMPLFDSPTAQTQWPHQAHSQAQAPESSQWPHHQAHSQAQAPASSQWPHHQAHNQAQAPASSQWPHHQAHNQAQAPASSQWPHHQAHNQVQAQVPAQAQQWPHQAHNQVQAQVPAQAQQWPHQAHNQVQAQVPAQAQQWPHQAHSQVQSHAHEPIWKQTTSLTESIAAKKEEPSFAEALFGSVGQEEISAPLTSKDFDRSQSIAQEKGSIHRADLAESPSPSYSALISEPEAKESTSDLRTDRGAVFAPLPISAKAKQQVERSKQPQDAPIAPSLKGEQAEKAQAIPAVEFIESHAEADFFAHSSSDLYPAAIMANSTDDVVEVMLPPLPYTEKEPEINAIDDADILEIHETLKPKWTLRFTIAIGVGILAIIIMMPLLINPSPQRNKTELPIISQNISDNLDKPETKPLSEKDQKIRDFLLSPRDNKPLPPSTKIAVTPSKKINRTTKMQIRPIDSADANSGTSDIEKQIRLAYLKKLKDSRKDNHDKDASKITSNSDSISPELLKRFYQEVEKNKQQVKYCYDQYIKTTVISGRMDIELTILPSGSVSNVDIITSRFRNLSIAKCIQRQMRRWRFDAFTGTNDKIKLQIPYLLTTEY